MKYYIWDLTKGKIIYTCKDFSDFLRWFAADNTLKGKTYIENRTLDRRIAMHPGEVYVIAYWDWGTGRARWEQVCYYRDILVEDEYGRTIDPRHYRKEILNYQDPKKNVKEIEWHDAEYLYKTRWLGQFSWRQRDRRKVIGYKFRYDSVPGIGKGRVHYRSSNPITMKERRISLDDMHKPYVRSCRNHNNLPIQTYDRWDYSYRHRTRSWKDNKKRKQWM